MGGERGNENDHGGNNTGNGTNYADWKIITKTEGYYRPTHADRLRPSMSIQHHDRDLGFI